MPWPPEIYLQHLVEGHERNTTEKKTCTSNLFWAMVGWRHHNGLLRTRSIVPILFSVCARELRALQFTSMAQATYVVGVGRKHSHTFHFLPRECL